MKTQIFKTRIITAILAILIIAVAAPQAGAQRREQGNTKANLDEAIKPTEKSLPKKSDSRKDYNKPAKPGNDQNRKDKPEVRGNHENKRVDKSSNNNENNNHKDIFRDDHKGNVHFAYKNSSKLPNPVIRHTPDFHFNFNLRPSHEYIWHRNQHISFRHLPRRAVWVIIDGENYAFYKNRFYLPGLFGFYRVIPPVYLRTLPEGCFQVWAEGKPMWSLHGIFFHETPFGFKIVI